MVVMSTIYPSSSNSKNKGTETIIALNKRLEEITKAFDEWKLAGLDEELLTIFIAHKTKLSKNKVVSMLRAQEEFVNKLKTKQLLCAFEEK
jgi:hypothetical protein